MLQIVATGCCNIPLSLNEEAQYWTTEASINHNLKRLMVSCEVGEFFKHQKANY